MGARRIGSMMVGVSLALCMGHVSARAADGAEAAEPAVADHAVIDPALEQIRTTINAETDPELRAAMEEQFHLLETGQLELTDRELGQGAAGVTDAPTGGRVADPLSSSGPLGPSTDVGVGLRSDESLPAEARTRLEHLFQEEGTGNPAQDGEVRAKAEEILKEYGIDPKEFGPGHEGDHERGGFDRGWSDQGGDNPDDHGGSVMDGIGRGDYETRGQEDVGLERAFEQMSPEAHEQMERFDQEREMEHGVEGPMHERDASMREFEAPTFEAPAREYEAPTHDSEAPQHEYEAPQQEYETSEHEAPQQEYHAPEQMEHEYQPPQP